MKRIIPLLMIAVLLSFCSQEKKLLRKAANSVERSEFEKAISYYDQIIQKDENSFFGNAGKGVVLSEFMSRHEAAIPYLEKALKNTPDKTKPILHSNLGRSYHFAGNYERALHYYGKYQKENDPKWADYDEFLTKRIADCKFAIEHPKIATPENQSLKNAGPVVNTDMPEYTPVVMNGNLIFTSKRKDSPKEKRNGIDGRFYEAIYIAENNNGEFSQPKRYELPSGNFSRKNGEAVMSISHDGQKLFLYKDGKIFEADPANPAQEPKKLDKNINFAGLQNHAALSADGKTLFFTSESDNGVGGSDIFMATKKEDGKWSDPILLPNSINTSYDEESPYINENGVLFFSSNGHPGYGGFDVYKSRLVNGNWTMAENLGQPINSPGDDIYFSLKNNSSKGYFASARPGGYGDLDIYHVHYVSPETTPCKTGDSLLTINTVPDASNPGQYNIELKVPDEYKNNIRSYRWEVNGQPVSATSDRFVHSFPAGEEHKIAAQLVVYCDSCPTLVGMCAEKGLAINTHSVGSTSTVAQEADADKGKKGKQQLASVKGKSKSKSKTAATTDNSAEGSGPEMSGHSTALTGNTAAGTKSKRNHKAGTSSASPAPLSEEDLAALNWNSAPPVFALNAYELQGDAKTQLDEKIVILKNHNELSVKILGYADSRGSAAYNKALSYKRALAVKEYLIENGINKKQIKGIEGKGETELVNNCEDGVECNEEEHQKNRRVNVQVFGTPDRNTLTANQ